MKYPKALSDLMESFQMLPGVGRKSAERLAFYIVTKASKEKVESFSKNLTTAITNIKQCSVCGMISDQDLCDVCNDETRNPTILVVESSKDAIAIEKTEQYHGKYHILNGTIAPLDGVSPDDLNIDSLTKRIDKEQIKEVILATSATMEGEVTALYISNLLKEKNISVTRIGYGLPAGADIEYADQITLIKALEGRKNLE